EAAVFRNLRYGVCANGIAACLRVTIRRVRATPRLVRALRLALTRRRGRAVLDAQNRLTDFHFVAGLHLDVFDLTRNGRGDFDGCFVGLELEDGLIFREHVARVDKDAEDIAARDVLAEFREREIRHVSASLRNLSTTEDTV